MDRLQRSSHHLLESRDGQLEESLNKRGEIHHIKTVLGFIWASGISHLFCNMTVITAIKVLVWSHQPGVRRLLLLSWSDMDV